MGRFTLSAAVRSLHCLAPRLLIAPTGFSFALTCNPTTPCVDRSSPLPRARGIVALFMAQTLLPLSRYVRDCEEYASIPPPDAPCSARGSIAPCVPSVCGWKQHRHRAMRSHASAIRTEMFPPWHVAAGMMTDTSPRRRAARGCFTSSGVCF